MLRNVSDTALWVAMYRAIESDRADALFSDPFARVLAGDRGQAMLRDIPQGMTMGWSMSVRTAVIDELIMQCVAGGIKAVVNLGAGLDARPFRLALPGSLQWLDVDLPEILAHRRTRMADVVARCRLTCLEADLTSATDRDRVFQLIRTLPGSRLVLTEGLLIYLAPEDVSELAEGLLEHSDVRWWITDLVSPRLLAAVDAQWKSLLNNANAPFRFALGDSQAFFESCGWREEEFRSTLDESIRLRRPPPARPWWSETSKAWWMNSPSRRRRLSGVALLAPMAPPNS